jgi:hypothetical protein
MEIMKKGNTSRNVRNEDLNISNKNHRDSIISRHIQTEKKVSKMEDKVKELLYMITKKKMNITYKTSGTSSKDQT